MCVVRHRILLGGLQTLSFRTQLTQAMVMCMLTNSNLLLHSPFCTRCCTQGCDMLVGHHIVWVAYKVCNTNTIMSHLPLMAVVKRLVGHCIEVGALQTVSPFALTLLHSPFRTHPFALTFVHSLLQATVMCLVWHDVVIWWHDILIGSSTTLSTVAADLFLI
ncbi:hypothetical protein DUNSADRAFT_15028 [Dunaliella salina]|uniref:Secreted protein n=1 Tax=Dunaliella salina TaxID=3046 RepID=A0ABQ7G698_DUNSA|nr:hypothetical protein DUNSADRAFT_15028 [Dunaliella salina]|eukprot:KAF5830112.1 hypothetical protein DUNSADRAFT_15028 [Dunaliella salina]